MQAREQEGIIDGGNSIDRISQIASEHRLSPKLDTYGMETMTGDNTTMTGRTALDTTEKPLKYDFERDTASRLDS